MRRAIELAEAAWGPYAQARGLDFRRGRIEWGRVQGPRVEGLFDQVEVAIELLGAASAYRTAVLAKPVAALEGDLEVTPAAAGPEIARLFGAPPLRVGDARFDQVYAVSATNETSARALLSSAVRDEVLALGVYRVVYDDGSDYGGNAVLMIELVGPVVSSDVLDRALRLAVDLARMRPAQAAPYR